VEPVLVEAVGEGQPGPGVEVEVHTDVVAPEVVAVVVDHETFALVVQHTDHPHRKNPLFDAVVLGEWTEALVVAGGSVVEAVGHEAEEALLGALVGLRWVVSYSDMDHNPHRLRPHYHEQCELEEVQGE
jgi:hypothetical protein